jgi:hypothetical protein
MWVRTGAAAFFAQLAIGALFALAPAGALGQEPAKNAPRRARANSPAAIVPGFETLADGSSRLFVELSQPVAYNAKVGRGTITYVLKGAHVDRRNNYNPLVTVHFNTPVTSARLSPRGKDLWFVIALRANVSPSVTMDPSKDGGAILRIEFPKGDYIPKASAPSPSPAAAVEEPADRPASPETSEAPAKP